MRPLCVLRSHAMFCFAGNEGGEEGAAAEGEEGEEGAEGGGEGVALFGNAVVQPVVTLPQQDKVTGEEAEMTVFNGG